MDTLPVTYRSNKNAWMTSMLFEEWIRKWDAALAREGRKIVLMVDNCTAHPHLDSLTNIRLEFLPANTMSLIQPMDQGVIKNLKTFYRKELVQITIAAIDDSVLSASCTAIEVSSKVSILDAIRFLAKSWRQVKAKTISNCFRKGGFVKLLPEDATLPEEPGVDANEQDDTLSLPEVVNGTEYLGIDDDAPCFAEDNHLEDDIVEVIVNDRSCTEDSLSGDDLDDDTDREPAVTHAAARRAVQLLERYFVEQGFSETLTTALDTCSDAVRRKASGNKKQITLDRFLS